MASLVANEPREIVFIGKTVDYEVETTPQQPMEVWERVVNFAAAPPFAQFQQFSTVPAAVTAPATRSAIAPGALYQAREYRVNQGRAEGDGDIIGRVDMPCLNPESRGRFLTQCAEVPQLKITPGGTFVSMSQRGATSIPTRVRAQLATDQPRLDNLGFPFFDPQTVVATALSDDADFIYRLTLIDQLTQPETSQHTPLQCSQDLFYIVLAWDHQGNWDYIWARSKPAPAATPEKVTTKTRTVNVRLDRLRCLSDSDDLSDGEATFTFVVTGGNPPPQTKTVTWDPMPTGGTLNTGASITLTGADAAGSVAVRVDGDEDDSGSFPPDDDDLASTDLGLPGTSGGLRSPIPGRGRN
jgi:hypothetical protein